MAGDLEGDVLVCWGAIEQPVCLVIIPNKQGRGRTHGHLHGEGHEGATSQGHPGFPGASEISKEAEKGSSCAFRGCMAILEGQEVGWGVDQT